MKIILLILVLLQIKCNSEVSSQVEFNKVAKCVACRFIWENIEEALGGQSVNPILAAEAFQYYCKISPDVFFQPCNDMFEKLYDMSENFAKKMTVTQLCTTSEMCEDSLLKNYRFKQENTNQDSEQKSQTLVNNIQQDDNQYDTNQKEENFKPLSLEKRKNLYLQKNIDQN